MPEMPQQDLRWSFGPSDAQQNRYRELQQGSLEALKQYSLIAPM